MSVRAFVKRCLRCAAGHIVQHRRKYASASLIYAALVLFGADLAVTTGTLPHWLDSFVESQRWAVPFATLAGHAGFILERSA